MRTPKQLLNIVGDRTMLQQSIARLAPLFPLSRIWVVTREEQAAAVRRQLPALPRAHVLAEPVGRNTAAAIGLAAVHLTQQSNDALMAVLPADHYIARPGRYLRLVRAALRVAARPDALVVLGIAPTRPETGYGYIERPKEEKTRQVRATMRAGGVPVYPVLRFTEKTSLPRARQFVASGRYDWNAGMFFGRVSTFLRHLEKFLPATYHALVKLADTIGTPRYAGTLHRIYPQLENISVDYAILEPATRREAEPSVFVLRAEVGWSDIGSWDAVYQLLARRAGENISAGRFLALQARGNFLWSPGKFIAAIGTDDLVVVETPDALLVCRRDRAQEVGRIVKWLEERRVDRLL
jgi:mannose-1-phosphate guanylyltransferase